MKTFFSFYNCFSIVNLRMFGVRFERCHCFFMILLPCDDFVEYFGMFVILFVWPQTLNLAFVRLLHFVRHPLGCCIWAVCHVFTAVYDNPNMILHVVENAWCRFILNESDGFEYSRQCSHRLNAARFAPYIDTLNQPHFASSPGSKSSLAILTYKTRMGERKGM